MAKAKMPGGSLPAGGIGLGGGGGPMPSGVGGYDWSLGMPLTRETDTTHGGTKPGKAPIPKAPDAPDALEIIQEQAKQNRVNEFGPSGSTTFSQNPDGTWNQIRAFSPELQNIYDQQIGLMSDPLAADNALVEANFNRAQSLLDPVFAKQERGLEQRLANQGLPSGSEAYKSDYGDFYDARNEAYQKAAWDSIGAGRASQGQVFNQMAALLGGQQTNPSMPLDVTGPYNSMYQGQMNGYNSTLNAANSRNQQTSGNAAALGTMLGSLLLACSSEIKENNETVDEDDILGHLEFLNVEHWNYKGEDDKYIGPYAEDFQKLFGLGDGKTIHVIDAVGVLMASVKALASRVRELEHAA